MDLSSEFKSFVPDDDKDNVYRHLAYSRYIQRKLEILWQRGIFVVKCAGSFYIWKMIRRESHIQIRVIERFLSHSLVFHRWYKSIILTAHLCIDMRGKADFVEMYL